jgi:hypothetical protein
MVGLMKKRLALTFCLLLAGCSDADWNHALNYTGLGSDQEAQADPAAVHVVPPPPPPAPVPNSELCRAVATQDATSNDFDPATQQRVFARSYSQCVSIYTR